MGSGQPMLHHFTFRLASVLVLGLVGGCGGQKPAQVFESVLRSPVPRSVVIINSDEERGPSQCSWVQFRATEADISSLLKAHSFVLQPNPSEDFGSLNPPTWWNPAMLGSGRVAYRWDNKIDDDVTETHIVFHNAAKDEVFAAFFSNW